MSNRSPALILARALRGHDALSLERIAQATGCPVGEIRRAKSGTRGRQTSAERHVKLCGHLGFDPVNGKEAGCEAITFDTMSFGVAAKMARYTRRHDQRQAGRVTKLSAKTLCHIEQGKPVSFEAVLAVCRYGKLDARLYLVPFISRETKMTGNTIHNSTASAAA